MKNFICVYDFETDGPNPVECQPVQIASCIVSPRTLEIVEDSYFTSYMRPEGIDKEDYKQNHRDTIEWHAKNYTPDWAEISDKEREDAVESIYQKWFDAPNQKQVFTDFCTYLHKYSTNQSRKTMFNAPIRAGINVRGFDNIIIDRLCTKYGKINKDGGQKIFYPRDVIDIMELAFYWFENLEEPKAYNMGELRGFFGMSKEGSHDALEDVKDEVIIIQKFMRLHRHLANKVPFKNAMAEKQDED